MRRPARVRAWLLAIAHNILVDNLVRQWRLRPLDEIPPDVATPAPGLMALEVNEWLASLRPELREVVRMRMDGYDVGEIAQRTGRTPPAVKRALSRARAALHARHVLNDGA